MVPDERLSDRELRQPDGLGGGGNCGENLRKCLAEPTFKSVTKVGKNPEKCDTFDCKFQVNLKIPEFCDRKV